MATTLLQALVSKFHGNDALKAAISVGFRGSPWVGGVPEQEDVTDKYVELLHQGETPDYCFERAYITRCKFQFVCWAVGLVNAEALAELVMQCFDPIMDDFGLLPITAAVCTGFLREDYQVASDGERDPAGNQVFHVILPYSCTIRRTIL